MAAEVLLIDDSDAFSTSIIDAFRRAKIEIERAATWEEGVAMYHVALHELVIVDYRLPGSEHGLKLLNEIKPIRPTTELILISGELPSVPVARILASGLVDEYLPKRGDFFEKLLSRAKAAVDRSRAGTDWTELAKIHAKRHEVSGEEIDTIDAMLRRSMPKT